MLAELYHNNAPLFLYGICCFLFTILCAILAKVTTVKVMGVNAYIKPLKFFLSIAIFSWSMAYFMQYLDNSHQVMAYNIVLIAGMSFELVVIFMQAAKGKQSHFNVSTPLDSALFTAMGVVITIVNLWTAYIGYLFFVQPHFTIAATYVWGIKLGIIFSVIFAFQGAVMGAKLKHTVGANDDNEGLPFLNWSKRNGDLRIAHFLGIHSLQVIPLGSLLVTSVTGVFLIATAWVALVTVTLFTALAGKPLLRLK